MSFLEQIGLLTLISFGIYLLNNFFDAQKEYYRKLDEEIKAGKEAVAEYHELEEKNRKRKKEEELIDKEIFEKQNTFFNKWENVDPEEEYLIRIGKIKSPLFNPDLYMGYFVSPWGSAIEKEKHPFNPNKINQFIKVNDIIKDYGISVATLELLYRGYINEYNNNERRFTDDELKMENLVSKSWSLTPAKKAKANLHQITLNKIIKILEELKRIGVAQNKTPVYRQE